MKTILVPTDFSVPARNALRYAVKLFGEGSHFVLMNAFEDRGSTASSILPLRDILYEASVDSLEEEMEYVRHTTGMSDLRLTALSLHSDPLTAVYECVREHAIDAVVVGTTGASGISGTITGSVATALMNDIPCPVLAIPAAFTQGPKKILLVSGPDDVPGWVGDIAKTYNSEVSRLTVKHDNVTGEGADDRKPGLRATVTGSVYEAFIHHIGQAGADLIVALPGENPLLQHILHVDREQPPRPVEMSR